jgi:Tol biopolymer transport system component
MLAAGQKLGPYEILGVLGEGGMGRVYRARDPKLNRDVAIKVLPDAFSADADRVARFTREARTLAALSHPNIAAIFGLEDLPGSEDPGLHRGLALVMELVPGDDLSVLVARGPMPPADAVPIARQIADALETAHEQGIIHRDLKPANIKVRADGTVKVLDFGLAKAITADSGPGTPDSQNSPTLTARATQMGMILGTAAYMSPEQAKGKSVDRRADIWAFGVVLYEMLTGRRAFEGEDVSTTLATVLMKDPDWASLPAGTPRSLETLVRRCLERDPRKRLRDIGEARILLSDPDASAMTTSLTPAAGAPPESSRLAWLVAAGAVAAAVVFGVLWAMSSGQQSVTTGDRIEASIALPVDSSTPGDFALSPNGRRIVLRLETKGVAALALRDLGDGAFNPLPHTAGGAMPFWSPNGLHIGFFADGKLKIVDLQGGPAQVICDAPTPRGGAWGEGNTIVFAGSFRTGLEKVTASPGSQATVLSTLDESRKEKSHRWPAFLPGGTHAVFVSQTGEGGVKDDSSTIDAIDVTTGTRTTLVRANSSPLLAPGHLLFWRDGALRAQAFDAARLTVSGDVLTAASGVAFDGNERAAASVSASGSLVYQAASLNSRSDLRLIDRSGRTIKTIAESVLIEGGVAVSHDGTRVAAGVTADGARDTDIWIYDLARGTSSPLFDEAGDRAPNWSHDNAQVFYENDRRNDGIIYRRFADGRGDPELVVADDVGFRLIGASRDGQWLVLSTNTAATGWDLVRYEVKTKQITPLVASPFRDTSGALSADDRWLAYASVETGRSEIWVRAVTGEPIRRRISSGGGASPAWRSDGRELYFVTLQGQLMAVSMDPTSAANQTEPKELFRADFQVAALSPFSPLPDGERFVINVLKDKATPLLTLVANWKGR